MTLALAVPSALAHVDWSSLSWVVLIAALTLACLTVKKRFESIAESGRAAEVLAHVVVAYFSLGMALYGASAVVRGYFPVPGGAGWEGGVAVIGGMAAFLIGATTLYEHVASVVHAREQAQEPLRLVSSGDDSAR